MTGAVILGMLVIAMFSPGFYSRTAISAGIGPVLAWHPACVVSRRIKERDRRRTVRARPKRLRGGLPEF
ncbi:hypothetical protein LZ190_11640 [Rhodovulum sulfidophilum]|nr:hypothetical protein [Rhodovulum sulfidophilum]